MNKKIASLLLIFLAALSIVYVCNSTALSSHATKSRDVVPSGPVIVTKKGNQSGGVSPPGIIPTMGDPIDSPVPH